METIVEEEVCLPAVPSRWAGICVMVFQAAAAAVPPTFREL
ncbi:MAG TPA: hypothetical protein PK250_18290 [Syntrophobacter fumaroxidans]|nr:hypothetical protein [Syntrophobacter fumaroxidans]